MELLKELMTVEHALWMGVDLTLGVCLKLMCDNGRVHWRDFVNDTLFWVPGVQQQPGDGLGRQVAAMQIQVEEEEEHVPTALAAK
jgi:hypothetical protein